MLRQFAGQCGLPPALGMAFCEKCDFHRVYQSYKNRSRRDRRKRLERTYLEWAKNWMGSRIQGIPVIGIPERPQPGTERPVGQPKPAQRRRELVITRRPRRSSEDTFVCTRSWQRLRARRYAKRAQKRSGFKGSYSNVKYLGLFPVPVHADEGIKPQPTFSRHVQT